MAILLAAIALLAATGVALVVTSPSSGGPAAGAGGSGSVPAGSPAAVAVTSTGCGRPAATGDHFETLKDQGLSRWSVVYVPSSYRPDTALPLVISLHGSGGDGGEQEFYTGMDTDSEADRFVVAYPTAAVRDSGGGYDWVVPGDPLSPGYTGPEPDDVAFLRHLVSDIETRWCIDPRRVYVTGFSRGARMTSWLACKAPDLFAAFAPVSGVRMPCAPDRPVSVLAIHGTADDVLPYAGGALAHNWTVSVPTAVSQWASFDRCGPPSTVSLPQYDASEATYGGCRAEARVALLTLFGWSHAWPGGDNGPTSAPGQRLRANETIWAFFAPISLPARPS